MAVKHRKELEEMNCKLVERERKMQELLMSEKGAMRKMGECQGKLA